MNRSIALNYLMSILKSIAESRTVTELFRILWHEFGDQYCIAYLIYGFFLLLCLAILCGALLKRDKYIREEKTS